MCDSLRHRGCHPLRESRRQLEGNDDRPVASRGASIGWAPDLESTNQAVIGNRALRVQAVELAIHEKLSLSVVRHDVRESLHESASDHLVAKSDRFSLVLSEGRGFRHAFLQHAREERRERARRVLLGVVDDRGFGHRGLHGVLPAWLFCNSMLGGDPCFLNPSRHRGHQACAPRPIQTTRVDALRRQALPESHTIPSQSRVTTTVTTVVPERTCAETRRVATLMYRKSGTRPRVSSGTDG